MTGPHRRDDPDAQRRTQDRRDAQNRPPDYRPPRGDARHPTPVHIVSASDAYFAGFSRQTGERGEGLDPAHGFRSGIGDEQAMLQSVRQVTDELRRSVDMAQQFQLGVRDSLNTQHEATQTANREQRDHLQQVLSAIESALTRQERREESAQRGSRAPSDDDRRPAGPFDDDDLVDLDDLDGSGRHRRRRSRPPEPPSGPGGGRRGRSDADYEGDRPAPGMGEVQGPSRSPDDLRGANERDGVQDRRDTAHTRLHGHALPMPARARSRGALRRTIERQLAEQVHQRYGEGTERSQTLLPQYAEDGSISHHILRQDGQEDEIVQNDDPRMPALRRMATRQAIVSSASAGLQAAGMAGAARAVPYVGWAIAAGDAANRGMQWLGEQNKISNKYQSIYAGDSKYGGDAVGQRILEEGYMWGQRFSALTGGMTEDDSRNAFYGVSQLGYKGAQRDTSLEFVQKQYATLGIDVNTSLSLVEASAKGANTQLAGLDKALASVGKMARATGQNANVLYESFAKNYQMALGMSLGANAPAYAAALINLTSGTTRDLSNVSYAPLASETGKRMIGAYAGHTYSWLESQYAQGNTEPYTQAVDRRNKQIYSGALAGQGAVKKTMEDEIAARGGIDKVKQTPGAWRDIARKMMEAPGADPENVKRYLSASGVEDVSALTDEQVMERLVQHGVGADNLTDATNKNKEQFDQKALTENDNPMREQGRGFLWLTSVTGSNWVRDRVSTDPGVVAFGYGERGKKNEALAAYTERQQGKYGESGTNKSDPVIESLIDKLGKDQDVGFKVQTGKGERVVSLADAIKYYPDQLAKGTATVVGGNTPEQDGQSVETIVGGKEMNSTDADSTKSTDEHGSTEDDWRKDNPTDSSESKDTGTSGGKIELTMSDDLKRWFSANVSGNVSDASTEAGASSSVPPSPSGGLPR